MMIARDRDAADDIAQDTFVSAIGALDSFDDDRPLRPWLTRIAANKSIDWAKSAAQRLESPASPCDLEDSLAQPEVPESGLDFIVALERLAPETRGMLVMRYVLDFRAHEIAEVVGLSPAGVRTRLHRALSTIRLELEE